MATIHLLIKEGERVYMNEQPFILDIDLNKQAVIEPESKIYSISFMKNCFLRLFQMMKLNLF